MPDARRTQVWDLGRQTLTKRLPPAHGERAPAGYPSEGNRYSSPSPTCQGATAGRQIAGPRNAQACLGARVRGPAGGAPARRSRSDSAGCALFGCALEGIARRVGVLRKGAPPDRPWSPAPPRKAWDWVHGRPAEGCRRAPEQPPGVPPGCGGHHAGVAGSPRTRAGAGDGSGASPPAKARVRACGAPPGKAQESRKGAQRTGGPSAHPSVATGGFAAGVHRGRSSRHEHPRRAR